MLITSKYESWCNRCGRIQIKIGDRCEWDRGVKGVTCLTCLGKTPASLPPRDQIKTAPAKPLLPPALAAMDALETEFVRMAAKTLTPEIDRAWNKYEKCKALAVNGAVTAPEKRVALKTSIIILVTAIFSEEHAYVC